jgi:hypothetical protein
MKFKAIYSLFTIALLFILYACTDDAMTDKLRDEEQDPILKTTSDPFEFSYWVDIDLRVNNGRGYWFNPNDLPPDIIPEYSHVGHTCNFIKNVYGGTKVYVIYHRQFEINEAKAVLLNLWKDQATRFGLTVVPTVVLENYTNPPVSNFTDDEILEFASWCMENINPDEFGLYDIYPRQQAGGVQDVQITKIKNQIGNKLVHVGLQPGQPLNANMKAGVEDTWTAECQGLTNELWLNPVQYNGTNLYGRLLLEQWVMERKNNESRRIVWNMIPVAWDYDNPVDPYGYISPGDDALINDPPIVGRIDLCHQYFSLWYGSYTDPQFGGYSCDLRILELNSFGRPEHPSFYECIREGNYYTGYFARGINEIAQVFFSLQIY